MSTDYLILRAGEEAVLYHMLREHASLHCRGRPAKRAALRLAAILVKRRQTVQDLVVAEALLRELSWRTQAAKV